jgi:hypothetical protein
MLTCRHQGPFATDILVRTTVLKTVYNIPLNNLCLHRTKATFHSVCATYFLSFYWASHMTNVPYKSFLATINTFFVIICQPPSNNQLKSD